MPRGLPRPRLKRIYGAIEGAVDLDVEVRGEQALNTSAKGTLNSRRHCKQKNGIFSDFEATLGNFKRFQADFNARLGVSSCIEHIHKAVFRMAEWAPRLGA